MTPLLASIALGDFDGHMDWDGDWSVLMVLAMVVFWVLVIGGIVLLLRELARSRGPRERSEDDPLAILDRRLADGSVSPEDYQRRRAILKGEESPPG